MTVSESSYSHKLLMVTAFASILYYKASRDFRQHFLIASKLFSPATTFKQKKNKKLNYVLYI